MTRRTEWLLSLRERQAEMVRRQSGQPSSKARPVRRLKVSDSYTVSIAKRALECSDSAEEFMTVGKYFLRCLIEVAEKSLTKEKT